jgi:ATP-dependent DNA helicase DinG
VPLNTPNPAESRSAAEQAEPRAAAEQAEQAEPVALPGVRALLGAAVAGIGGVERTGQTAMAEAVESAIDSGEHLAVQAGTGTGKSLAYLVPALRYAVATGATVVVSTATIALQRQLIDRDLPRLATALTPLLGREPSFAILKGRRNYLCLNRLHSGAPEDPAEGLFDPKALSALGRQVKRLHEWAEETETGDRDELVPGVGEPAWRQVAVSARECLGAQRCPQGGECFAELARAAAGTADIVVTNHALLAIAALEDYPVLPEHDLVVIDEAHELVDRVTSVATGELSATAVETAARRCGRLISDEHADRLHEAGEGLAPILDEAPAGRMDVLPEALGLALATVRDAARGALVALRPPAKGEGADPEQAGRRRAALASTGEVHDTAARLLTAFEPALADRPEVVWLSRDRAERRRWPPTLHVAPITVSGLLRTRLFARRTTVLTSATLSLGGSFDALARQWGLPPADETADATNATTTTTTTTTTTSTPTPTPTTATARAAGTATPATVTAARDEAARVETARDVAARDEAAEDEAAQDGAGPLAGAARAAEPAAEPVSPESGNKSGKAPSAGSGRSPAASRTSTGEGADDHPLAWSGVDVGSPFEHAKTGILYIARHLPPPGRDGLPDAYLTELAELIEAAGGRTLGLFSSMRAARRAADELRDRIEHPVLCQGDDSTALLVRRFADDARTCLFGTLSLWQGVDVPGPSLQLVVVDRIPFPRPDDPIASARQRAVAAHGGNGFMTVAAAHAALLLAQGTGRLLRTADDRGVVAVLDPRLSTARYGGYLLASLPPYWTTTDPDLVRAALRRIDRAAGERADGRPAAPPQRADPESARKGAAPGTDPEDLSAVSTHSRAPG